jgi:hypothetical protein
MFGSPSGWLVLLLVCAAGARAAYAEEPPGGKQPPAKSTAADKKTVSAPPTAPSPFKIPTDAVIFVCEHAAEALRLVPDAVILTPKKYQEMLDEIARLRALLQAEKALTPSTCHLKGKVEGDLVQLQVQFDLVTERASSVIALACRPAVAISAQLDGRTPLLRPESDGFSVQIDKPGKYQLTLELLLTLSNRNNTRGLELALPRAAITTLDLELPGGIKDLRADGQPFNETWPFLEFKNNRLHGGLGTAPRLELSWKEARPPAGPAELMAESTVQVRLEPGGLTTEAELALKVERGQTGSWRLLLPLGADLKIPPAEEARVKNVETANHKIVQLRTIHLKEPSADPLRVLVYVRAPLPRAGVLIPIGPFTVLGAPRQRASVVVRNLVGNVHLDYHPHGELIRRSLTEERDRDPTIVAAFSGAVPAMDKPPVVPGPASLPRSDASLAWLELEAETLRSQVRAKVAHTLTLHPEKVDGPLLWYLTSVITVTPKWNDVEQVKVQVPEGWEPLDDSTTVTPEKGMRVVSLKLPPVPREGGNKPVPLTLEGRYTQEQKLDGRITLGLPRPLGFIEQGEVTLQVPPNCEAFLPNPEQADLELVKSGLHEQSWRCRRAPPDWQALEVGWHAYHPELQAVSVADVELIGSRGEVTRHEIRLQSSQGVPSPLVLRVPVAVADSLKVVEGGPLQAVREGAPRGSAHLTRLVTPLKTSAKEYRLVLSYSFAVADRGQLSHSGETFAVPLVVPEQATRGETKVRVWSEPGRLPSLVNDRPWDERNIEEVKDHPRLPVLVLQAQRLDAPLQLRAGEQTSVFTVLVEKALVRASLHEGGAQSYRVSYQVRQLAAHFLDVELPAPVPTVNLRLWLDRKEVIPDIVNEAGQQTDGGTIARLRLSPELVRHASLLEVAYQLPPGRTGSPVRSLLLPPRLRGAPPAVPALWQVTVPPTRVLIAPESTAGLERTWTRRGWLLAAGLGRSNADLEREFEDSLPAELRRDRARLDTDVPGWPALVCWQDTVEPLTVTHAPQQAWLLVCSLGLLILGLALYWSARSPTDGSQLAPWLWPILAVLNLAAAVATLFWPTTLWAIVYGCEPGMVVLAAVVGLQWLMHQRYRRQIVFLPSFSRSQGGSSLLRKTNAQRPRGEPSTVDAPPPGSSIG